MKVGFIGIGQMGSRMAKRILDGGYDVFVHDSRKEAVTGLLEKGAKWRDTPRQVAETCRVVLDSLPGPREVEDVVYGPAGLIKGWQPGDVFVDMTSSSHLTTRRVAQDAKSMGVEVLDSPVSGSTQGAETGTLVLMVGGSALALDKVRPILETMAAKIFHVGGVGCGDIAKTINNMISCTCNAISGEGFVLAVKAGLDADKLREVIKESTGNNWWLEHYYPRTVLQRNFEPGFRLALASKDVSLAVALGKEYNVPIPVCAAVQQEFIEAVAAGLGDKGTQSLILRLESIAGVQVGSTQNKMKPED